MSVREFIVLFILAYVFVSSSCVQQTLPPVYIVRILKEFPHDPDAFTQGLVYAENNTLFESTGLYGKSSVRQVALQTGKIEVLHKMDDSYFGEGLTLLHEKLYQLVWQKNIGFIYDRYNLSNIKNFTHQMTDGWGLATDGKILYGSDGTSILYKISPDTFKVIEKHNVTYNGHQVFRLNELEYINGEVWANVWQTNCIARISAEDGTLTGWIYAPNLRQRLIDEGYSGFDVLNGIAWDEDKKRTFLTGKLWPKLFQVQVLLHVHPIPVPYIEQQCLNLSGHSTFEGVRQLTMAINRLNRI